MCGTRYSKAATTRHVQRHVQYTGVEAYRQGWTHIEVLSGFIDYPWSRVEAYGGVCILRKAEKKQGIKRCRQTANPARLPGVLLRPAAGTVAVPLAG
jgi:hypothetical protein